MNFPKLLGSIRQKVLRLISDDPAQTAPTPPEVRPQASTVVLPQVHLQVQPARQEAERKRQFLGPQTEAELKVLMRLLKGPATPRVLRLISKRKRPRYVVASLRQHGLEIPVTRRPNANSLFYMHSECIYTLTRRDKSRITNWIRSLDLPVVNGRVVNGLTEPHLLARLQRKGGVQ